MMGIVSSHEIKYQLSDIDENCIDGNMLEK